MKNNDLELLISGLARYDYEESDNSVIIYLYGIDIDCRVMDAGGFKCEFYKYDDSGFRHCYRRVYNTSYDAILDELEAIANDEDDLGLGRYDEMYKYKL